MRKTLIINKLRPLSYAICSFSALMLAPAAVAADDDNKRVLETVTVKGDTEDSAVAPLNDYAPVSSGSSTKSATAITQTPQSLSVVGRKQLQDTGANSIMSGLQYTAGFALGNNDNDMWESFYLRGFKSYRAFRDGMKFQVDAWDGRQEIYNVERIEVSKGASSMAFAGDEPGGAINTISKRPTRTPLHEVGLSLGRFGEKALMTDISDNISADGQLKYRLVGIYRDKDSYINHVESDRVFIAPSLQWQLSDATQLTVLSEFQRDNAIPLEYGVPKAATVLPNPHGQIKPSTFLGEPGIDQAKIKRANIGYELKHRFNEQVSLTHKARYFYSGIDVNYTDHKGLKADHRTLRRPTMTMMDRNSKQFTTDTFVSVVMPQGNLTHHLLVGVDASFDRLYAERYTVQLLNGDLDIFNPQYGRAKLGTSTFHQRGSRVEKLIQTGIYAQDQLEWDKWTLTLGGRYGYAEWGERSIDGSKGYQLQDTTAFTSRGGLTYEFDNGFAPFISFSQSFRPQGGKDKSGNRFDPTRGQQFELGLRYQPTRDILVSAVAYHLTKSNILTPDLSDHDYQVQTGEAVVKGFELEAQAKISDDLSIAAAYTHTRPQITQSNKPEELNQRLPNIPENQASIWTKYRLTALALPQATVGFGIRHVGETDNRSDKVPAYTLLDASVSYDYKDLTIELGVKNLTDKRYISSCAYTCAYGEPLSVMTTLKYRF